MTVLVRSDAQHPAHVIVGLPPKALKMIVCEIFFNMKFEMEFFKLNNISDAIGLLIEFAQQVLQMNIDKKTQLVSNTLRSFLIREGAYVRVIGNLRSFKDTPNIVAFDLQVVEDFNQLTYHMLRAMYTHSLAIKKTEVSFFLCLDCSRQLFLGSSVSKDWKHWVHGRQW